MTTVLVVEDEESIRVALADKLRTEGFQVEVASGGLEGLEAARRLRPGLVILDLMLPGLPGLEVLRRLRSEALPSAVIVLTARDRETDRVVGLELGADDYVTKPFSVRELVARVRAVLRRGESASAPAGAAERVYIGDVEVDFAAYRARRGAGEPVPLSPLEARMLRYLVSRRGRVVPRDEFLNAVWGYQAYPTTRTVDFHVKNLRRKIEEDPSHPRHIVTVHGVGYRFDE
ncbi:MAG: response regulator transcription factor [Planctomycetes bacterium]|nr:response regulator transcription factor [Planctomycetota bacterium]